MEKQKLTEEQKKKLELMRKEFNIYFKNNNFLNNDHIIFYDELYEVFAKKEHFFKIRIKKDKNFKEFIFNGNDNYAQTTFWSFDQDKLREKDIKVWNKAKTYGVSLTKNFKKNEYYFEIYLRSDLKFIKLIKKDILDKLNLKYEYKEIKDKNEGKIKYVSEKRNSLDDVILSIFNKFNKLLINLDYISSIKFNEFINMINKRLEDTSKVYFNKINKIKENNENSKELNHITKLLKRKKQIILYGPPGTGKTYSVKEIIESFSNENYEDLEMEKRVKFITFHQSYSYEEFIEGLKPKLDNDKNIIYDIERGTFKDLIDKIILEQIKNLNNDNLKNKLIEQSNFDLVYNEFLSYLDEKEPKLKTKAGREFKIRINENNNILCYPENSNIVEPYYLVSKERLRKVYENKNKISDVKEIKNIIGGAHHSYYFAILKEIEKIKKTQSFSKNKNYVENINLINEKEILEEFYKLPRDERKKFFDNSKPYFLIIDEINRGNISKIFGELITLLESDKRLGEDNELIVELPYSKEEFGIPPNLYIIGTMNTADKSIVYLDIALRRRFGFVKYLPEYEKLKKIDEINLGELLKKLNLRIKYLLGDDYMLGHSYFLKVKNLDDLKDVFYDEIIPLLEEYFNNDLEKIKLVLGSKFFGDEKKIDTKLFEENEIYDEIEFKKELKKREDVDFKKAIENILNPNKNDKTN